jgi:homoserine kinase
MPTRGQPKSLRNFEITLPATSANLGPAFDAAALAFRLFLNVKAKPASNFSVTAVGVDSAVCSRLENHLIIKTYREILQSQGKSPIPIALQIRNEMPIGKGCGSSAAARLAGIALAVHFGELGWDDSRIIGEASHREHHPDNASACWLGGLTVARMIGNTQAQVVKVAPKGKWPLLFAVPSTPLSTDEARRVLPGTYTRKDAVHNLQSSMLLLAALVQGRRDVLTSSLDDRFHQPYRAQLCPLLPAIQELSGTKGVLGAVLSGAGPSVLVFIDPKLSIKQVSLRIRRHLQSRNLQAELIPTSIEHKGARDRVTPPWDGLASDFN